MTTRFSPGPLIGLAILVSLCGLPLPLAAQGRGAGPPPAEIATMQAREADDIALLLALRPDQRPALTAFLQTMMPPPPLREDRERAGPNAPPSDKGADEGFTQHLDRMSRDAARRSTEDARRIAVARTFYDGLDPTQRRAFAALMRLRHGPGPHGLGPHGPGRGGPMHGPGPDGDGPPPMGGMPPRP